jgi:hypothetical protein
MAIETRALARSRLLESRPRKERRLGLRAAMALAAVIKAQEQAEALAGGCWAPDEWAPFMYADEQAPGTGEGGADGERDESAADLPAVLFSHAVKQDGEGRHYYRSFSSVRDFCEQPFANPANEELFKREEFGGEFRSWAREDLRHDDSMRVGQRTNESWYGAATPREAMDRASKGWPEGAERVRSMMDEVDAPPPVSLRRKMQRADQGDELDIHEVYRGGLDRAWTRRRRQRSRARMSVRLVAQIGGHRHTTHEEMFWRGAAVLKLAELLEESSYRVEMVGVNQHLIDGHDVSSYCSFVVKEAGAPLDVEQVAGVLCNAGFFRTYGFRDAYAICEHRLADKTQSRTLLARSYVMRGDAVRGGNLDADGTKTFSVPMRIGSKESAVEWVNKCLAALENGGEEKEEE